MKLNATTTSERASKEQGGNVFLYGDYTFLKKELSKLRVYVITKKGLTHFITHNVGLRPMIRTYDNKGQSRGLALQEIEELEEWAIKQTALMKEGLTDEQIKAYRLADNKLNESDWDMDLLDGDIYTN